MKLEVIAYMPPPNDFHKCIDEKGKHRNVDIMVDGKLTEHPEKYVGSIIECEYLVPYMEIAMGIQSPEETP